MRQMIKKGELTLIRVYRCEKCGLEFNDFDRCLEHELDEHPKIVDYEIIKADRYPPYLPTKIKVKLSNDAIADYVLIEVSPPSEGDVTHENRETEGD